LRISQIGDQSFRRQHPAGHYVLDFYCPSLRLAIELDGGQHAAGRNASRDTRRDRWLQDPGVTVLRFWNNDVTLNLSGVLETIAAKIAALRAAGTTPTTRCRGAPPPFGGGEK
jgi:very-short-patch-repair endonuclease